MKPVDIPFLCTLLVLQAMGFIMLSSASMYQAEVLTTDPFYFLSRQSIFLGLSWGIVFIVWMMRLRFWEKYSTHLFLGGIVLLMGVLIAGKNINGSTRWLDFGLFSLQASELVKLGAILYLARFLVQHQTQVKTHLHILMGPLVLFLVCAGLLLAEPDLGATAVIMATALGLLFIGGVALKAFAGLLGAAIGGLMILILMEPYRLRRLTGFLDPWEQPFGDSFQLVQSLIAYGRGEWIGVGLGNSVQKLLYLPEAHTDFLLAILAEEWGFLGICMVIASFGFLIVRIFQMAGRAEQAGNNYAAYVAYGIGLWIGLQAVINMGVTLGLLPTKGLTLPFMSYGGSSTLVMGVAIGLLLRIDYESYQQDQIVQAAEVDVSEALELADETSLENGKKVEY